MRDDELLELWTRARPSPRAPARTGVLACGAGARAEPAEPPMGELNRALLAVWRAEFGDRLECVTTLPRVR